MPAGLWEVLRAAQSDTLDSDTIRRLSKSGILIESDDDEFETVLAENELAAANPSELLQVVLPSSNCQLGCGYCGQDHRAGQMTPTEQDALLGRMRGRLAVAAQEDRAFSSLHIGWFGGEPLLGLPVIRRFGKLAQELALEHGCDYSSDMVTNGVGLTPRGALELQETQAVGRFEITLDGPRAVHDRRRHTKSGSGSFDRIIQNLLQIANDELHKAQLTIRCNVDRWNASEVPDLLRELAKLGLQTRIGMYFAPIHAWGNSADEDALALEEFAALELTWFAEMIDLGFAVNLLPVRKPTVCLAIRRDARVTDADGVDFNCTEVPYVATDAGRQIYQILPKRRSERPLAFRNFNSLVRESPNQPCKECHVLPLCGGACPKSWSEGKVPCPSYKINLGDRLSLQLAADRLRKTTDD